MIERIVAVCGSRKPAPGVDGRSAARELLRVVCLGLTEAGAGHGWLDLRDLDLPLFDGRGPDGYPDPDLARAGATVAAADVIVLSVPAYWGGPSGVVKNFLDLLGGPAYDAPPDRPPPLLVVGADPVSGPAALGAMRLTLATMGAWVAPRAEVIGDPRSRRSVEALLARLKDFGGYIAGLAAARPAAPAGPTAAEPPGAAPAELAWTAP
jgi:NAD(P)H-dependent FMN reductase